MLKTSTIFLKTGIYTFHTVSCTFSKSLLVSAGNSLFCVMFKVLRVSWIIAVDSLFKKSPQRKVSWH